MAGGLKKMTQSMDSPGGIKAWMATVVIGLLTQGGALVWNMSSMSVAIERNGERFARLERKVDAMAAEQRDYITRGQLNIERVSIEQLMRANLERIGVQLDDLDRRLERLESKP